MPVITGVWGKVLNVIYNLLKALKGANVFNQKPGPDAPPPEPKPPIVPVVLLAVFLAGCTHIGDVIKNCVELAQTCEIETSNGQCVCKPSPSPSVPPSPEPTPSATPTPTPTPTPTTSPTPAPTPEPATCNLPPRAECGGPENPPGSGQYGCCATKNLTGQYTADIAAVHEAVDSIPGLVVNGVITDKGIYITSLLNGLRNKGYCVVQGGPEDEIGVKKDTNEFSEQYDVIIADNKSGYFLAAVCKPARF